MTTFRKASLELTRDEWRQRDRRCKAAVQEVARERREHPELHKPVPEDPEIVATGCVLNDESLQRGDIIATKKGMFIYRGDRINRVASGILC